MNIHTRIIRTAVISAMLLSAAVYARGSMTLQLDPTTDNALSAAILKVADEAYELNKKGLDALDAKNLDAAQGYFEQALAIFPQYSDALNNIGVALYRRGNVAAAQKRWEDAIKLDPQYHVGYYNLGLVLLHGKKPAEAVRQFELALKHNKRFTEAMVRIGAIHLEAGRTAAAVDQLGKAWKGEPANQDAWNFYSYGLLVSGDTAGAVSVLKSVGDNAAALSQLGRIEASRKRYADAADYFAKAIARGAPPSVAIDLASVQVDAGKCRNALSTLNGYFSKEPNPGVDPWLLAGFAAKECDGLQKALEQYEKGLQRHPRDPLLLYNAGQIHFALNNYAKAEEMWNAAGDAYRNPQMLYNRAMAARARNDLNAAERHIKEALSMDEKAEYYDFLGVIQHIKGNGKAAEEHFRKALKIDPSLMSAQLNLAVKSRDAADLDKAVADASKRLSSCGDDCTDAALQLSILHHHQRKYDKALSALESLKNERKDARIYRHIAIYNKELQKHDKAAAALEAALAKSGGDAKLQYELAEAYLSAGQPSKAAKIFTDLMPKWKDNVWRLHYQLGYAYMDMNDLTRAKASFEKSMSVKKENPAARALLAFVLNRMGETEKAMDHWAKTIQEDGSNATIHINLGLSHENKGEYGKALESYKKAQTISPADKAININMGNAYKGMERIPEAFEAYTAGLSSAKRDLAAYSIFVLAREKKDNQRAEKMFALLNREFPSSTYSLRASGEMDLQRGDTAKAVQAYEAVKEKDAHDWFALAQVYAARGQKDKAESALAKMPDDGPWAVEKKVVRAKLAFRNENYKEAYQYYKDAAVSTIRTQGGGAAKADAHLYNMILSAYNGKMYKEAISAADDAAKRVQRGGNHAEICRIAGNSAVAIKSWTEARNWFSQLVTVEPNNAITQYNLAVAHYNLNEVEDAYKRYQKARELDKKMPPNKDIENRYEQLKSGGAPSPSTQTSVNKQGLDTLDTWYNRAVDLQNAKKVDQAEKLYGQILERDPLYGLAWNNLGAIYGARGDLDMAIDAYLKALETQTAPETFANLANVYIAKEDYAKARGIIAKGLASNPKNAMLTRLEQQIKSK